MNNETQEITYSFEEFRKMFHVKHFRDELKGMGIELSDAQLEKFYLYYKNLIKWNSVMNLTTITELDDVLTKHFLDSLSIVKAYDIGKLNKGVSIIDVGTGAGFPGLPLAICFDKCKVTLMDSLQKRIKFLDDTIELIGVSNCKTVHSRAEDLSRDKAYREKYDLVCPRAVADLRTLSEYCLPFTKVGGTFVAYKSAEADEEISSAAHAIKTLGGKSAETDKFELGNSGMGRTLVRVDKTKLTSLKYPRKAGTPQKEPL